MKLGVNRFHGHRVGSDSADDDNDFGPARWSRLRIAGWISAGGITVVATALVVWFSPLFSVREVAIDGQGSISQEEIVAAMDVKESTPLLRVDTAAAAQRISRIPRVAQSRVQVDFPSRIRVNIIERTPAVFFDSPQGAHLMDSDGIEFALGPPPPWVPRLTTEHPGAGDPATASALAVLAASSPALRGQIGEIAARSISDITLTLRDGRLLEWGSKADSVRKAAIALPLLGRPGHTYDVSSPDLPTVK